MYIDIFIHVHKLASSFLRSNQIKKLNLEIKKKKENRENQGAGVLKNTGIMGQNLINVQKHTIRKYPQCTSAYIQPQVDSMEY